MSNIENQTISQNNTIKDTLEKMDRVSHKVIFVLDDNGKLQGSVSDGDIRRAILNGRNLNLNISSIMNTEPIYFNIENLDSTVTKKLFTEKKVNSIPVLNKAGTITDIISIFDILDKNEHQNLEKINAPVVIIAGGEGRRLHPLTKVIPKPLIPIGEKSILELIMDRFVEAGAGPFHISVNYRSNLIKAYMADSYHSGQDIDYLDEDLPLGTIGCLSLIKNPFQKSFFCTNCDILVDISLADLYQFHEKNNHELTIVASVKDYSVPYGVLELSDNGSLAKVKEKPTSSYLVNTGLYVMSPAVFNYIDGGRIDIDQLLKNMLEQNAKIGVYPVSSTAWSDMGQHEELGKLQNKLKF